MINELSTSKEICFINFGKNNIFLTMHYESGIYNFTAHHSPLLKISNLFLNFVEKGKLEKIMQNIKDRLISTRSEGH